MISNRILPYIQIARPDHWFKNVFMLLGAFLACFYHPDRVSLSSISVTIVAFISTCLIASSNYVINEILDAPSDKHHPLKCFRPIPSGKVRLSIAYGEWLFLLAIGILLAGGVGKAFLFSGLWLFAMGIIYNVPPIRSKDLPYVDVLSESINNPIRLILGWFAILNNSVQVPPVSFLIFYWMIGAFFMAAKRFAEYRMISDPKIAAAYRKSFLYYNSDKLLVSLFFYSTSAALFLGVFIIRYKLELILGIPAVAGFFSYYTMVMLKHESAAQAPERLYKEKGLMAYLVACVLIFILLMFSSIPVLYRLFNVEPSRLPQLWSF
jgi:decaprenyl-phosphate phosphoribosyltransferase